MRFTKMHGNGNDYVYVNAFDEQLPDDLAILSRKVSDRHFGIGSDGLIVIGPSSKADARMRMFNNDGSEAEMCGNGIRCVAKYVHDHDIARKPKLAIETGNGILHVDLEVVNGLASKVRVDMGEPILESTKIPTTLPSELVIDVTLPGDFDDPLNQWWTDATLDPRFTCVSMGNPHVVFFCGNVDAVPLETVGPVLEKAALFPNRINVHFVQIDANDYVTMRTWERGSGITLACGTGACAVAVAGALTRRTARKITAKLPGGELELEWSEADNHVYMTGPATEVYTGDWPL